MSGYYRTGSCRPWRMIDLSGNSGLIQPRLLYMVSEILLQIFVQLSVSEGAGIPYDTMQCS